MIDGRSMKPSELNPPIPTSILCNLCTHCDSSFNHSSDNADTMEATWCTTCGSHMDTPGFPGCLGYHIWYRLCKRRVEVEKETKLALEEAKKKEEEEEEQEEEQDLEELFPWKRRKTKEEELEGEELEQDTLARRCCVCHQLHPHLAKQLRPDQMLLTCWTMERKHRFIKPTQTMLKGGLARSSSALRPTPKLRPARPTPKWTAAPYGGNKFHSRGERKDKDKDSLLMDDIYHDASSIWAPRLLGGMTFMCYMWGASLSIKSIVY